MMQMQDIGGRFLHIVFLDSTNISFIIIGVNNNRRGDVCKVEKHEDLKLK